VKKIGERIKAIRLTKQYTQEALAEELAMTKSAFSKIERGDTDANISRLIQIAKVLEVDVRDFFDEAPVAQFHQSQNPYGYATKQEVQEVINSIQEMLREILWMKAELQRLKTPEQKKAKSGKK
jgi:transcriptional regulator with XRE-family HTH domain